MTLFWFTSFIILLLIEILTINLITVWFAIGALSSMILSFSTNSLVSQLLSFIIVSLVSLLITKPLINRFKKFEITPTNSDMVIGKIGEVTKKIESNKYGEVKIFGNTWTAMSSSEIEVGARVKVLRIEGVKLIVKKEDD